MNRFFKACLEPFAGDPTGGPSNLPVAESSLAEIVLLLPAGHRARREYDELVASRIGFDPEIPVPASQVWSA